MDEFSELNIKPSSGDSTIPASKPSKTPQPQGGSPLGGAGDR